MSSIRSSLLLLPPPHTHHRTTMHITRYPLLISHKREKSNRSIACGIECEIFCNESNESLHLLRGSVRESCIPESQVRDDPGCSNLSTLIGSE